MYISDIKIEKPDFSGVRVKGYYENLVYVSCDIYKYNIHMELKIEVSENVNLKVALCKSISSCVHKNCTE